MPHKNYEKEKANYQKLLKNWRESVRANIAYRREQIQSNLNAIKHLKAENAGMLGMIKHEEKMLKGE